MVPVSVLLNVFVKLPAKFGCSEILLINLYPCAETFEDVINAGSRLSLPSLSIAFIDKVKGGSILFNITLLALLLGTRTTSVELNHCEPLETF